MARGEIRPKDILPDKYTGYVTLDDSSGSGRFFIDKLISSLAPICVPGTTYPANSYVMHQGLFYKVNSQMTGFESNKVTQKSIKDVLVELSTETSTIPKIQIIDWDEETNIFNQILQVYKSGLIPILDCKDIDPETGEIYRSEQYYLSYLDESSIYFATADQWGAAIYAEFTVPDPEESDPTAGVSTGAIHYTANTGSLPEITGNKINCFGDGDVSGTNYYTGDVLGIRYGRQINCKSHYDSYPKVEVATPYTIHYLSHKEVALADITGQAETPVMLWREVGFTVATEISGFGFLDDSPTCTLSDMLGILKYEDSHIYRQNNATDWTINNVANLKIVSMDDVLALEDIDDTTGQSNGSYYHEFLFSSNLTIYSKTAPYRPGVYLFPVSADISHQSNNGPKLVVYDRPLPVVPWSKLHKSAQNSNTISVVKNNVRAPVLRLRDKDGKWRWI